MTSSAVLERGLDAFAAQRWADAFAALSEADATVGLDGEDLDRLAIAANLLGREDYLDMATRAHEALLQAGDEAGAARVAAWIGLYLMDLGEPARSGGWLARAGRLAASDGAASVGGLVLAARAVGAMYGGQLEPAAQGFEEALVVGERYGDRDTLALARLGLGQVRIGLGDVASFPFLEPPDRASSSPRAADLSRRMPPAHSSPSGSPTQGRRTQKSSAGSSAPSPRWYWM